MKQALSEKDSKRLDELINNVEKRINTQIVLALIQRCDVYAELPWKSFALGASVTGLLVFILDQSSYGWQPTFTVLIAVAGILTGGALFALLTLLIPGFAKLFLSDFRAEAEVKQYAESMFLTRELFATSERTGILLLISTFERKVVILPDKGLSDLFPEDKVKSIIASMTPFLRLSEFCRAFEIGLEQLSKSLETKAGKKDKNELSDEIILEKGV